MNNNFSESEHEKSTTKQKKKISIQGKSSVGSRSEWDLGTVDFRVKIKDSDDSGEIPDFDVSIKAQERNVDRRRTVGERSQDFGSEITAPNNSLNINRFSKFRDKSKSNFFILNIN